MFMSICFIRTLSGEWHTISFMLPMPVYKLTWPWRKRTKGDSAWGKRKAETFNKLVEEGWIYRSVETWTPLTQRKVYQITWWRSKAVSEINMNGSGWDYATWIDGIVAVMVKAERISALLSLCLLAFWSKNMSTIRKSAGKKMDIKLEENTHDKKQMIIFSLKNLFY